MLRLKTLRLVFQLGDLLAHIAFHASMSAQSLMSWALRKHIRDIGTINIHHGLACGKIQPADVDQMHALGDGVDANHKEALRLCRILSALRDEARSAGIKRTAGEIVGDAMRWLGWHLRRKRMSRAHLIDALTVLTESARTDLERLKAEA